MGERQNARQGIDRLAEALRRQNEVDRRQDQAEGRTPRRRLSEDEARRQSIDVARYRDRNNIR